MRRIAAHAFTLWKGKADQWSRQQAPSKKRAEVHGDASVTFTAPTRESEAWLRQTERLQDHLFAYSFMLEEADEVGAVGMQR